MAEDQQYIFSLNPIGQRAVNVFDLRRNRNSGYYVPAPAEQEITTRDVTPSTDVGETDTEDQSIQRENYSSGLLFRIDQKPKDIGRGFVFGSSSTCDVTLGRPEEGISGRLLRVTVDESGYLFLESKSRVRITVSYNKQAEKQPRYNFKWIFFPNFDIKVTIEGIKPRRRPKIPDLEFQVQIPVYELSMKNFNNLRDTYTRGAEMAIEKYGERPLDLHLLDIESQPTTAGRTEPLSPRENPIYIRIERVGSGLSGIVYKGVDVSTGHLYALKYLCTENLSISWKREVEIMRTISHVSTLTRMTISVLTYY